MEKQIRNCVCCGYQYDTPFEFEGEDCCPCCGINIMDNDYNIIIHYQSTWLSFRKPWMDNHLKPENWEKDSWPKQMKNIPHPYNKLLYNEMLSHTESNDKK